MKSKIAFVVIAFYVLLLGVAAAYLVQVSAARESYDFTLTVRGRAYDPHNHEFVDVSLSLMGTGHGRLTRVMILYVTGGDLEVENYGTLSVSRRCGVLVKSCRYIYLHIRITPPYGGRTVVWNLRGRVYDDTVSFTSRRLILPLPGYPKLYRMWLTGAITVD